jgi:hypothetical protein
VAAPGLDAPLPATGIAHRVAHRLHHALDRRVADELARPHVLAQLLLRHDALAVRQGVAQDLEHLGAQEGGPVDALKRIEVRVERAVSEDVAHGCPPSGS